MPKQFVPIYPTHSFEDYTYCSSLKCRNACGRLMSNAIREALSEDGMWVSYGEFCDAYGNEIHHSVTEESS